MTDARVAPVLPLATQHIRLHPIGLESARLTDGPWADWQHENRTTTTPHAFAWLERDGTVDNLRRLDPAAAGEPARRGLWFTDSDLYKTLEAVAWDLGRAPSSELENLLTALAGVLARAQTDDGYLNSFVQAGLGQRWGNLRESHELYCIGHLIQAGIAHHRATGRSELFDVAVRAADAVVADFGNGRRGDTDGHEQIEMALVELYRETHEHGYLDLARQLVDVRGHRVLPTERFADSVYYQDATPVRDETTVVGHAVRAVYLLCGVVDLYVETGERALLQAAIRQWESMTHTKTYLTGAIGSRFVGEAFGDEYELPPDLAYGETCATIGTMMLSWRLLLVTGEARFADAIERGLYNLFAASTSLDRAAFFYNNPAQRRSPLAAAPLDTRPDRADAPGTRPVWFECACCPPNIMRTVASLPAYLATHDDHGVQLHQFMPSDLTVPLPGGEVRVTVETRYPLDGVVTIHVQESPAAAWTLSIRRPHWATGVRITVNGQQVEVATNPLGYLEIARPWKVGDVVVVALPVQARLTVAHPAVDALRGTVAIERGPLVYALESPDQGDDVDLNHVELLGHDLVEEVRDDFLGRPTVVVHARGRLRDRAPWAGAGWRPFDDIPPATGREIDLVAIPYALWANRGPSVMRIFVPTAQ